MGNIDFIYPTPFGFYSSLCIERERLANFVDFTKILSEDQVNCGAGQFIVTGSMGMTVIYKCFPTELLLLCLRIEQN